MTSAAATTSPFSTIPVIDLARWRAGSQREQLADQLREICHRVGFFSVVGHGVPTEFITGYFDALQRFFALPEAVKAQIDKTGSRHFRGWERVGAELTDNRTDFREQLDLATANPPYPTDTLPAYLRLDGPNQWLPEGALPGFRAQVEEFLDRMAGLAGELMAILSTGLGLAQDHLHAAFGEQPMSLAKLIHYPPTPPGQAGVNSHHDAGFLTILWQHGVGGLQAVNPDGTWIDVPPREDAFVVNLGEMLQAMTGNYLVATTHRVITTEERYSSAYFHGPDLRARLDPLPLDQRFADAVAASPRHAAAGFMAQREELLAGDSGTVSQSAAVYGQQLWNYYLRSYPENVRRHYPDLVD